MLKDSVVIERVTQALATRSKQIRADWDLTPAAVLMPIFFKEQVPHLLLTKRSATLRDHSGEVAFPGGRCDPEDGTPTDTALREAEEEIGLRREDVTLLGELDPTITITGYLVNPVVGTIPYPYDFNISRHEIDRLIEVPLPAIARPEALEVRERVVLGRARSVYYYHYGDSDPIWGASGRLVQQFLQVVYPLLGQ